MADTEEYFPRGGKKPIVQHFKQSSNFLGAPEKSEKKKKKPKKKSDTDDGYLSEDGDKTEDKSYYNCAVGLSLKTIKSGMLVLGRVYMVNETKVRVMLPGRIQGMVMACHVSEPYNKLLEAYVNDQTDSIKELPQIFRPGQYVAVKVLEVTADTNNAQRRQVMLSIMPQHVNGGKTHADLHNGCLLQAAVSSEEDHGYVMDIGISNTKAFLPKKNNNPELELDIGALYWCTIKSVSPSSEHTIVTLTTHADAIQGGVQRKKSSTLLPGTGVDFVVDKPLDNGIEGHIFADTTSYVQRQHADKVKGKKPALGQKVRARVLFVMPTRNTPFLTLRNIFETVYPDLSAEQKYREGDIVEDAQVIKIMGRSVQFKLGKSSVGYLNLKRIAVDEDLSDEEVVSKSYPVGSTHKVRVLCYHLSDYTYSVSDQASVLKEKYFSISQLKVGEVVDAKVTEVAEGHLKVTVGRVNGFVSQIHMSDAGVFVDPKKASISKLSKKKFKAGQELKARVLWVDVGKQQIGMTVKPTLLSPELEVLSDYHQAEVGKGYTGVIKIIRDYILVSFFNNVVAYVPRHYVTKDENVTLTDAFHIGQIVNCTILRVDPEAKKMSGSLVTVPFWPEKKRELKKRTNQDNEESEPPTKKKKANKTDQESTEENERENKKDRKKKRHRTTSESEEISESDTKSRKKKRDKQIEESNEHSDVDNHEIKNKKSKKKKTTEDLTETENDKDHKKKRDKKASVSEESDAIETDMHEEEVLTPVEQHLVDFSDCDTPKKYKKRIVSLLKNINARTMRLERIKKKIENIEEIGLTAKNKKYHTAMHMDKLIVEDRIKILLEALTKAQENLKQFGDIEVNKDYKKKKGKKVDNDQSDKVNDEGKVKSDRKVKGEVKVKVVENLEPALEVPSAKDFWSTNADAVVKNVENDESSSSDDEQQDQPKKKRKKLSAAEKVAKVREEEERVREMERRAIDSQSQPRSSDQFERALLANPDCSQLWIAYMAFHLQATEIEKARAVGRKALNTINFREEQERLNVWIALLNCEHRFGTKESQQKTLEEALQMNDRFQVHSKLLDILVETSKQQELVSLVDLMMRKYKQDPQNYIQCGNACFKLGLVDKARQVMQKAVAVLEKKEHVSVLVQFALMERQSAPERAEALFEQVLAVYPQRVDVCSVYVDMLMKSGDGERIRQVMERMTSQKLPARKMKILYRKWIEVEEKLGDQEQVEAIRQKAMDFIDKAKF